MFPQAKLDVEWGYDLLYRTGNRDHPKVAVLRNRIDGEVRLFSGLESPFGARIRLSLQGQRSRSLDHASDQTRRDIADATNPLKRKSGPLQFGKPSETIVQRTDGSALSTMIDIHIGCVSAFQGAVPHGSQSLTSSIRGRRLA